MMALTRDDLKELPKLLQEDPDLRLELARLILDKFVVSELMRRDTELAQAFRTAVLTEELLQLPARFERFEERFSRLEERFDQFVGETTRFQEETTHFQERMTRFQEEMTHFQERMTRFQEEMTRFQERMTRFQEDTLSFQAEMTAFRAETTQRLERLERDMEQTKQGVKELQDWRRGEEGRRAGEEYERKIVRRARRILGEGQGGSPKYSERVNEQVELWLEQAGLLSQIDDENDPAEADLVWWKGNRVALAEISIKVDRSDVIRAKRRAEVLQQAGLEATPVVIGAEWAHPETELLAQQEGVAWRIGNAVSDGLVAFRKASASE
ncbi:MAG: hypothetical protein NZ556_02710 [Fimbriimonadales bacterium]|nr:hypothetical protein [Fimbriimonadales bacterium]